MMPLAAFALAACAGISPGSDRVLLRDLAAAFPSAELAGDTPVALAPVPGVERRFDLPELRRIAASLGLPEPAREVCVARPVARLEPARILEAMRTRLPKAEIELLDFSHWPVPEGPLEFPPEGLHGDRWTGAVQYAGGHRFAVWARVRVRSAAPRAVAAHDLRAGQRLAADDFRIETDTAVPDLHSLSIDELAGRRLRRAVRAGAAVRAEWTEATTDVARGETVKVEVRSGAALLAFDGLAQACGNAGQTVAVVNPQTRKRFQARVDGPGRVSVNGASVNGTSLQGSPL
jgi:flagella basal body P-ring formation protein FlgA